MKLEELQRNWDTFGATDPFWAILTWEERRGGAWTPADFYREGEREIGYVLARAEPLGLPAGRGAALDFGCGAGRLTQALCCFFDRCTGVDIAPSMVRLAQSQNLHGDRCRYVLNVTDRLAFLDDESCDFIYTNIVLQHMRPEYAFRYLEEFLRVLTPGGLLVFQLPSEQKTRPAPPEPDRAPLPAKGFRARIEVLEAPAAAPAATPLRIRVRVRNESPIVWRTHLAPDDRGRISLGNRWHAPGGDVLQWDDGRALLPRDLPPGTSVDLELAIVAPSVPGSYVLEVDMVQEGVSWFSLKGSQPARHPFTVTAPAAAAAAGGKGGAGGSLPAPPVMEMYATPLEEVSRFLRARGAELLRAEDDGAGGGEWKGFLYWVTKPGFPRRAAAPDRELAALIRAWEARGGSGDGTGAWSKLLEETLTGAGLPRARRRALVVGCGEGGLPAALAPWFEESWGVELTPGLVRRAEERNGHVAGCRFRLGVPGRLVELPDAGFDLVVVPSLLHHLRGMKPALEDLARLVAPGGVLACSIPEAPAAGPAPHGTALPAGAFRARIPIVQAAERVAAGGRAEVRARVRNLGSASWPAPADPEGRFPVSLGNHWLGPRGGILRSDDARTALPGPLAPGDEVELALAVTGPLWPGPYTLELDLVQDGVSWFEDRGSETTRCAVTVVESDAPPAAGLPIRWVSLEQCRDVLTGSGLQVFATAPEAGALPGGTAVRVFARR